MVYAVPGRGICTSKAYPAGLAAAQLIMNAVEVVPEVGFTCAGTAMVALALVPISS